MSAKKEIITMVNDRILTALASNIIPWRKPWTDVNRQLSQNLLTKNPYNGINQILTNCNDFQSPYWATFNQILKLKGKVKSGEKSTPILYWNFVKAKEKDKLGNEIEKAYPFLKYFNVFNLDQVEGIPIDTTLNPIISENDKIDACDSIVEGYINAPEIRRGQFNRCAYNINKDLIVMQDITYFKSNEDYYATLFHELVHSTGHKSRLNREEIYTSKSFGSKTYSKEELTAELGASYLCALTGIESKPLNENSEAYIKNWLSVLKNDVNFFFSQSQKAQKAVNYILKDSIDKPE